MSEWKDTLTRIYREATAEAGDHPRERWFEPVAVELDDYGNAVRELEDARERGIRRLHDQRGRSRCGRRSGRTGRRLHEGREVYGTAEVRGGNVGHFFFNSDASMRPWLYPSNLILPPAASEGT